MDQSDDWVQVRNCNWVHQAHFVKSVLESEGIEAQIPDEHTLAIQPLYGTAIGGVRVMVRAIDLQRATELLDAVDAAPAEPLDDDAP